MAETSQLPFGQENLDIPNINIQLASIGGETSSESDEEVPCNNGDIPNPREKGEAEGKSEDSADDTSTWDSDPATPTPRSSRDYYPMKGTSEKSYPSHGGDNSGDSITVAKTGYSVDLYLKTLNEHLREGNGKNKSDESNLSGISLSTTMRVVDGGEDNTQAKTKVDDDDEEEEELKCLQEDGNDEDQDDDDFEKLDLTMQNCPNLYHRSVAVEPHTHIMFAPSFDELSVNPINALMSQLIGNQSSLFHLQGDSSTEDDGENLASNREHRNKFGSGDWSIDEELQKWEELFKLLEIQHSQQQALQQEQHKRRMAQLKQLMTQQQVELQELQFNNSLDPTVPCTNRVSKMQINVPYKGSEQVTSPGFECSESNGFLTGLLHRKTDKQNRNHYSTDSDGTAAGNYGNNKEQTNMNASSTNPNIVTSEMLNWEISNSSELGLETPISMTTWSDIKNQRSETIGKKSDAGLQSSDASESSDTGGLRSEPTGDRDIAKDQFSKESNPSSQVDLNQVNILQVDEVVPQSHVEELQSHFEKEKKCLQKQYVGQLQTLQQQWHRLQQQQQEHQQVLHHLLTRQQERIEHQQRVLDRQEKKGQHEKEHTLTGTIEDTRERDDSDISSTTSSNFTYWRLRVEDTYKALPLPPAKDSTDDQEDENPTDEEQLASSLRLKEKHSRHVADLKSYYEAEILELKAHLAEVSRLKENSPSKEMEMTNERLQQNGVKLKASLAFANSRIQDLEKTVGALGARLREQPDESVSTASTINTLQQVIKDLKQLCHEKHVTIQQLEKKTLNLQISLRQAYQLQDAHAREDKRDQKMLNTVMNQYKAVTQDHELTKVQLNATEMQLYDAKLEVANLKRKVSHLEVEVKRLSHENSKLHVEKPVFRSANGSVTSDPVSPMLSTSSPLPVRAKKRNPTTGYNFSGEYIETSSESPLPQASDTKSNKDKIGKTSRLSADNRPSNLSLHPGPFDSDLDDRSLSPMMKAVAQFQRWTAQRDDQSRMRKKSESSEEDSVVKLLDVSTQTQTGIPVGRPSDSQLNSELSNNQQIDTELPLSPGMSERRTPTADSGIHIWPESEPKNRTKLPVSTLPERKQATSPRNLARQSLANFAKTHSTTKSHQGPSSHSKAQSVNPRRNLAFQFKDAGECERGSPLGSSSLSERVDSSRTGYELTSNSSYLARRGLLEGREGLSSVSPTTSVTHMPAERENVVETTLAKVRDGDVLTRPDRPGGMTLQRLGFSPGTPKNAEGIGHKIVQKLEEHEKRLDELMLEKRQLETALSHVPTRGSGTMQQQEKLEEELEKITRELGSVRMLLRKYNALKTS